MTRKTGITSKRKLMVILFAIYVTFILISTIPYLAEQNLMRSRSEDPEFVSHLVFPEDGEYNHYKNVKLINNESDGKIDLKYKFDTNTLYIQKIENIKELTIDCQMLYENNYKKVFKKEPSSIEFADLLIENDGLFTVIINSDTPMDKLQFLETPLPNKVLVNKVEWWKTSSTNFTLEDNNITITKIPKGSTTVEIYFKEVNKKSPKAMFTASDYIALSNETITFDASGSSDQDGEIIDYIWHLGDSTKNITKVIKHSYSEAGNYTVTLYVRDDDGLLDFYSENITIVGSNKSFKKIIVDEIEIDVRSVVPQNLTIEKPAEVPEIPEETSDAFGFFLNITSEENVSTFQLKIDLGPIGGDIIPAGTNPDAIKLYYYDEDTDKWVKIEDSYYDPKTGILTAKLDHLTIFAPMASKESGEAGKEGEEGGIGDIAIYILIIVIVIAVLCIIGLLVIKQKRGKGKVEDKEKEVKDKRGTKSKKRREIKGEEDADEEKKGKKSKPKDRKGKVGKGKGRKGKKGGKKRKIDGGESAGETGWVGLIDDEPLLAEKYLKQLKTDEDDED